MGTLRLRLVAVIAAAAAAALLPAANAEAGTHSRARDISVTGYQQSGDKPSLIDADRRALTDVGVDGVVLMPAGGSVSPVGAATLRQLATAHADGLRGELLVSNWSDRINDFSEPLAHSMLASSTKRAHVAGLLAADATGGGWDGITIDIESLRPRDTAGLTQFLFEVKKDLSARATLGIDLMNATSLEGFEQWGYDLAAIGRTVDDVALMAYDEHGPWEQKPGPVNALPWQRKGLDVLLQHVPRSKVDLGVAGYGYEWMGGSRRVRTLTDAAACALVKAHHATPRWNARDGEWTARFHGTTVWWSDVRSYKLRVTLARKEHLHGLAIWSLAQADVLPAR